MDTKQQLLSALDQFEQDMAEAKKKLSEKLQTIHNEAIKNAESLSNQQEAPEMQSLEAALEEL